MPSPRDRFLGKVVLSEGGCWEWVGSKGSGYGQFWWNGRLHKAHRFAYEAWVADIPSGLQLDHLCRNRACVNPDHLEPVTPKENVRRGAHVALRTPRERCPHGHPYDEENTRIKMGKYRECRTCARALTSKWRAKRRMEAQR